MGIACEQKRLGYQNNGSPRKGGARDQRLGNHQTRLLTQDEHALAHLQLNLAAVTIWTWFEMPPRSCDYNRFP